MKKRRGGREVYRRARRRARPGGGDSRRRGDREPAVDRTQRLCALRGQNHRCLCARFNARPGRERDLQSRGCDQEVGRFRLRSAAASLSRRSYAGGDDHERRHGDNIIPEEAEFCVDIRTLPAQSEESVERRLKAALGADVELRKLNSAPSVGSDSGNEWIQEVFGMTERLTGLRPVPAGAMYVTDCSILTPAYGNPPTIILGPGEPEMMHKTDEFCYVSKIEYATAVYGEIARRWCAI